MRGAVLLDDIGSAAHLCDCVTHSFKNAPKGDFDQMYTEFPGRIVGFDIFKFEKSSKPK